MARNLHTAGPGVDTVYASTTEGPVLLVGTAHVVDVADPLRRVLRGRDLQGIAVELDAERARALLAPPAHGPAAEVPFLLRLWSVVQKRLGEEMGDGAGAEMRTAARLSNEWGIPLFLIDDPIRETVVRLLRGLTVRERLALLLGGIVGLFVPARLVTSQLGEYNRAPEVFLTELRDHYPGLTRVLLDDRNEHMAERLLALRREGFGRLAAVVGD
ncbi:MAG: TraB/GumN family protein, partial [Thermoplasmata archaeon]